ncbi:universal stress protein [Inhella sp.]|uniref:universal stress protein n=1 Tax=Inhella sp. TaxID=1921806 RepID=UPI0035B01841
MGSAQGAHHVRPHAGPHRWQRTACKGLDEAIQLARLAGSILVLIHVVEVHPMMVEATTATVWEQLSTAQYDHARGLVEGTRQQLLEAGLKVEAYVQGAAPAARVCDAILAAARSKVCQLIVMGTHGRCGTARAPLGSDAELVLRASPVHVLLVRGD